MIRLEGMASRLRSNALEYSTSWYRLLKFSQIQSPPGLSGRETVANLISPFVNNGVSFEQVLDQCRGSQELRVGPI